MKTVQVFVVMYVLLSLSVLWVVVCLFVLFSCFAIDLSTYAFGVSNMRTSTLELQIANLKDNLQFKIKNLQEQDQSSFNFSIHRKFYICRLILNQLVNCNDVF